jgi:ABC-type glycerol-3-phosphate transport system substrate-binding protein
MMALRYSIAVLLFAACASQPLAQPITPSAPTLATASTTEPPTATPFPTPSVTPPPQPLTLRFWLPDTLAGLDNVDAGDVLAEQIGEFESANANIEVEVRLRSAEGVGGLLEALRNTAEVAPTALPDITLLRYEDFRSAGEDELLAPLNPADLPPLDAAYASGIAAMAFVGEELYGVPSTVELLHLAAPGDVALPSSWRFDAVIEAGLPLLFPAAPPSGIADVFLLQYLTAGGADVSDETLLLDEPALRATLRFYERAVDAELIPIDVLEYDIPDRYAGILGEGMPMVVNSHMVLQALRRGKTLAYGYVPTLTGEPVTLADGWLWVITTGDPERQRTALRFLTWMLATERQAAYHRAIERLPAATAAQRQVDAAYAAFIAPLLDNMILPGEAYREGALARALQNAYAGVISGQSSANDALEAVLAQMGQ